MNIFEEYKQIIMESSKDITDEIEDIEIIIRNSNEEVYDKWCDYRNKKFEKLGKEYYDELTDDKKEQFLDDIINLARKNKIKI